MRYAISNKSRRPLVTLSGPIGRQPDSANVDALRLTRWNFRAAPSNADLTIDSYIGDETRQFLAQLDGIDADEIDLYIDSEGGSVFDGLRIYAALQRHPAFINGHVSSIAASAAAFLAMGCDRLEVAEGARMMIHNASGIAFGESADLREMADLLDSLTHTIAEIFTARSGRPLATIEHWMANETWFTGPQAVAAGLADSVYGYRAAGSPGNEAAMVAARLRQLAAHDRLERGNEAAMVAARLRQIERDSAYSR